MDGAYFHYTYDAVGNRLSQSFSGGPAVDYTYDIANRLTAVGSTDYTWDDNGNLLNDGASDYAYDAANRLVSVTQGEDEYAFGCNGQGDRLVQTVNSVPTYYSLDLHAGLTQVLDDGTNTYLYGHGRLGELQPSGFAYHFGDALGSVRQLVETDGDVALARSYEPYGSTLASVGDGATVFQFTGEARDGTDLTYLRARYYSSGVGRLVTKDVWHGDQVQPMSYNAWLYVLANPTNLVDPTGHSACDWLPEADRGVCKQITGDIPESNPLPDPPVPPGYWRCPQLESVPPPAYLPARPVTYEQYGHWFHYLFENVRGWWNNTVHESDVTRLIRMLGSAFSTEVSQDEFSTQKPLADAMAEAFTRKGWGEGVYREIGSRSSVGGRLLHILFRDVDPETHIGTWRESIKDRDKAFVSMMNDLQQRQHIADYYGPRVLLCADRQYILNIFPTGHRLHECRSGPTVHPLHACRS